MREKTALTRVFIVAVALIALSFSTTACSPDSAPDPTHSAAEKLFEGTPAEYTALFRACVEEKGLAVSSLPGSESDQGFMVDTEGADPDTVLVVNQECTAEIGQPKIARLSEDELRERYEARTQQWSCLLDQGLVDGTPLSFETFADQYRRSGESTLWEPTAGARSTGDGGPTQICPRSSATW